MSIKGGLSETVKGNIYRNIVSNGNFASGTTGWGPGGATINAANNTLNVVGNGTASTPNITTITSIPAYIGQKVFIKARIKVPNGCTNISLYTLNGINPQYAYNTTAKVIGGYAYYYGISPAQTEVGSQNIKIYIRNAYADAATSNDKVMEVQEVMAIDLTAIGLDALTVDQCNARFQNWFDSTKSTLGVGNTLKTANF
jgi:hypothetical protein